jgi:hypothetical protein
VAVVDGDFPAGVMHVPMVGFTQQYTIFYTGFTIVDPVQTMMRLAHSRWPITTRKNTAAVPRNQRSADR